MSFFTDIFVKIPDLSRYKETSSYFVQVLDTDLMKFLLYDLLFLPETAIAVYYDMLLVRGGRTDADKETEKTIIGEVAKKETGRDQRESHRTAGIKMTIFSICEFN